MLEKKNTKQHHKIQIHFSSRWPFCTAIPTEITDQERQEKRKKKKIGHKHKIGNQKTQKHTQTLRNKRILTVNQKFGPKTVNLNSVLRFIFSFQSLTRRPVK